MSSDRLKSFASFEAPNDETDNWDNNFEGDLITIQGPRRIVEPDTHELETIRPYKPKPTVVTQNVKPAVASKSFSRKTSRSEPPRPKSPVKAQVGGHVGPKFVLPARPAVMYREQSVEDYSDLFVDNESIFDRRLSINKV